MGTVQSIYFALSECLTKPVKVAEVSRFCMRRGDSLSSLVTFDFSQPVRGWLGVSEHEVLSVIYPLKACIPSTQVSERVPGKDLSGLPKASSAKGVRQWRQKRNDDHNYSKGFESEKRRAGSKEPDLGQCCHLFRGGRGSLFHRQRAIWLQMLRQDVKLEMTLACLRWVLMQKLPASPVGLIFTISVSSI